MLCPNRLRSTSRPAASPESKVRVRRITNARISQRQAMEVGRLALRISPPSWLESVLRPAYARGPTDLAQEDVASPLLGYADRPVRATTRRRYTVSTMIIGIDAHKRSHPTVTIDDNGRQQATKTVGTTSNDGRLRGGWLDSGRRGAEPRPVAIGRRLSRAFGGGAAAGARLGRHAGGLLRRHQRPSPTAQGRRRCRFVASRAGWITVTPSVPHSGAHRRAPPECTAPLAV